eukprot:gene10987-14708_t
MGAGPSLVMFVRIYRFAGFGPHGFQTRESFTMGKGFGLKAMATGGLAALLMAAVPAARADDKLTVFAAASLKDALDAVNKACEADVGEAATVSYAASSALAKQIAAFEGVAPEQIVLGEILDVLGLYLSAQGGPGGEFIYSEPGYTALVDAVAPAGGKAIAVPLDDRLNNDLPAIASAVNVRTRAVYLVNPHNPSGTVSPAKEFIAFVRDLSNRAM